MVFVFLQASGYMPAPERFLSPVDPCAARSGRLGPRTATSRPRGLSPIGLLGASEKCAKTLGALHTRCTTFPQAQICDNRAQTRCFCGICRENPLERRN